MSALVNPYRPAFLLITLALTAQLHAADGDDLYAGSEFDMPGVVVPSFPDRSVSITEFGAVGDGQMLNTGAVAQAIASMAERGGGRVVIPRAI